MIFIADLHLGVSTGAIMVHTKNGDTNSKSVDTRKRFEESVKLAMQEEDKTLVLGGDIFNSSSPDPSSLYMFLRLLWYAAKNRVKVHIIGGNHDSSAKYTAVRIAQASGHRNVVVHLKPSVLEIGGVPVIMLPHMCNKDLNEVGFKRDFHLYEWLNHYITKDTIVVSHAQVGQHFGGPDRELETGTALTIDTKKLKTLPRMFLLGHIHNQTHIRRKHVMYPGSLVPCTFGEIDDVKGYIRATRSEISMHTFRSKIHRYEQGTLNFVKNEAPIFSKGAIVKLIVVASDASQVNELEIRKQYEDDGIHIVRFVVNIDSEIVTNEDVITTADGVYIIRDYVKAQGYSKRVYKKAMSIYEEADS